MNKPPAPGRHPRAACSPDLGGPWAGAPARLSPIFAVSHRLSPLKVSAFFKRTLRPPAPPGGVFLHKAAHICSLFFVQTGELPQELFTPPHFVAFFCNKPPHSALWVKGLFHTHHPHHTAVIHRTGISRCPHAFGVPERAVPGPTWKFLLPRPLGLRAAGTGTLFSPVRHTPRPHLENFIPGPDSRPVAIIFVAFLQNPAKQPPFLCETKIFCKISSF